MINFTVLLSYLRSGSNHETYVAHVLGNKPSEAVYNAINQAVEAIDNILDPECFVPIGVFQGHINRVTDDSCRYEIDPDESGAILTALSRWTRTIQIPTQIPTEIFEIATNFGIYPLLSGPEQFDLMIRLQGSAEPNIFFIMENEVFHILAALRLFQASDDSVNSHLIDTLCIKLNFSTPETTEAGCEVDPPCQRCSDCVDSAG